MIEAANAGDASAHVCLARLQSKQNKDAETVANQWECALNLQEKLSDARSANESTMMEAFASTIHEQGKVDQTLNLETLWIRP